MIVVETPNARPARAVTISVVIPCYNYGHFVESAIDSALQSQPGVDVQVIVVDDASRDDSAERVAARSRKDSRITLIRHSENHGHIRTYNEGLAAADGELVTLLSADDLLTPGSLSRSAALFEENPNVGLVYGPTPRFSEPPHIAPNRQGAATSWVIRSGHDWARQVYRSGRNVVLSPEAILRTSVQREVGGFDPGQPHAGDLAFWLCMAARADVGYVAGVDQALYREHNTNMHSVVYASDAPKGMVTDLRERLKAFDQSSSEFTGAAELMRTARRALAVEAVDLASRAYVWGLTESWPVDALVEFALETEPMVRSGRAWRALARRRRVGTRLSHKNLGFVVREKVLSGAYLRQERSRVATGL